MANLFFIKVFFGQKYGFRPFPANIFVDEFDSIIVQVSDDEKQLLKQWFQRDDNNDPAQYVLQPITSKLAHFSDKVMMTSSSNTFIKIMVFSRN